MNDLLLIATDGWLTDADERPLFPTSRQLDRLIDDGLDIAGKLLRVAEYLREAEGLVNALRFEARLRLVYKKLATLRAQVKRIRAIPTPTDAQVTAVLAAHRDQLAAERHGRIDALVASLRAHPRPL